MPFFDDRPTIGCPDCGKESTTISKYCRDHYHDNWHLHFAWYPVKTLERVWVWFSIVNRKPIPKDYKTNNTTKFWYRLLD